MMESVHTSEQLRADLQKLIASRAFFRKDQSVIISPVGKPMRWIFDFRPLLLTNAIDTVCELFWRQLEDAGPFQVGGLETAAITLVTGMVLKGKEKNVTVKGFYVRKSRRKDGLQRSIEGDVSEEKIILVDDALNSGKSIMRQIKVLDEIGKKVSMICSIIRFRDESFYEEFHKRGIKIFSLFTLDDFPQSGGMEAFAKTVVTQHVSVPKTYFDIEWKFASDNPSYFRILPKSALAIDDKRVYFGADNGYLWALNQSDGSLAWSFKTLYGADGKRIFSSPAISNGIVYFGAYDGNFYALDAETGKKKWIYMEADWIGSSPCVAEDLGVVFVGLEFGLWKKQGGLVALDLKTGDKKWRQDVETMVHSSPAYSKKLGIVVVGSTEGKVYAFEAKSGKPLWTFTSEKAVRAGLAFDDKRGLVVFGSEDKCIYIVSARSGEVMHRIETLEPVYSTPLIHDGVLYFGILDKRMLCVDLDSGKINWEFWAMSRIFSTSVIVDGKLYFGSNDGRLYELDPTTGKEMGYFQATERIVNKIAYNPSTKRFFVPTYANEIYCLTKKHD
jgi:outer membrane protein assembly factor BamB/orotate phosphoribosyltransferase